MCLLRELPTFRLRLALASLGWFLCGSVQAARPPAPTEIGLSANLVVENASPSTLVGVLTAMDPDPGDSHTFSLVPGTGSDDNHRFSISGNQLTVPDEWSNPSGASFDFESQQTLSIRLRATDSTDLIYEAVFAIQVSDDRTEDADDDGLDETEEEDDHGSSDLHYDTDNDGFGDGVEILAPSSPTDPNDWPDYPLVTWGENRMGEPPGPLGAGFHALSMGQLHTLGLRSDGTVTAWGGLNLNGETTVASGLNQVVAVAAGGDLWLPDSSHSLALKRDGTVVAWGNNDGGRLTVPEGLGGVVAIAAGRFHCLALRGDGTVASWGRYMHSENPVPAGLSDVVAIADGGFHSLALKSDGTVVAWGEAFNGQTWENVTVPAGLSDVVAISAGRFHSLALKSDGSVVAWGSDVAGQATVPENLGPVVAIAAGGFHSLALMDDGSVVGWGFNEDGQMTIPTAAGGQVRTISAGVLHSHALRQSESAPAITSNSKILSAPGAPIVHQLTVSHAIPVQFRAIGLPGGLTLNPQSGLISGEVAGPARRSIQIQVDTNRGRLSQVLWLNVFSGLPPTDISLDPAVVKENSYDGSVVGALTATDPDVGDNVYFELVSGSGSADNRRFVIFGNQLVVNGRMDRDFEADPSNFSIRVRARDASLNPYEKVIAVEILDDREEDADNDGLREAEEEDTHGTSDLTYDTDGDSFGDGFELDRGTLPGDDADFPTGQILFAWGSNDSGQTTIPPGLGEIVAMAAGGSHNLALRSDGTVAAWGLNDSGQCDVPADLANVVAVEAGGGHSLAVTADGTVWAWGNNDSGQGAVPGDLTGVVALAAGNNHNLALKSDGTVVAWGNNESGQSLVPEGLSGVVAVAAGTSHSLALKRDGSVEAWGADWSWPGQLSGGIVGLAAGGFHSLGLASNGTVAAWGHYQMGQLSIPQGLGEVTDLEAGWLHAMALTRSGTVVAWGSDVSGQSSVPFEALEDVQTLAIGALHSLALRQAEGFPKVEASTVVGWPGQQVSHQVVVSGATPAQFSAVGLPVGLMIDPLTGVISGTVVTGERRVARITVETDKGRLSRILWCNTVDGVPPVQILLSPASPSDTSVSVHENSPAGTLVGTLTAIDPDVGDTHVFEAVVLNAESNCLEVSGNQLVVGSASSADHESSGDWLFVLLRATDSASNVYETEVIIQLFDDRTEDFDRDGLDEAREEDYLLTSDLEYDDLTLADADDDGVPTLIEYAFNLDLQVSDPGNHLGGTGSTSGLPIIYPLMDGDGEWRLRIEYLRRIGSGLTYRPEFASGLTPAAWAPATGAVEVTPVDVLWERCVIDDDLLIPSPPARFGRVAVGQ